jgi:GntR family transcriptional regulator/MocR family aminotransferase
METGKASSQNLPCGYDLVVRIPLDRDADEPLFRQIERWLRGDIASGGLPPSTRLPSTRALADDLGVSRITVANAYAELDRDGLITSREGSGTFVAAPVSVLRQAPEPNGQSWPLWQREIHRSAGEDSAPSPPPHPEMIAFTGVGDPRMFPVNEFGRTIKEVLARDGTGALEYGPFDHGYGPLRETVVQLLASQGIHTNARQVLITSGSQQAIALTCQVLVKRGDTVLVEQPTYNLALDLFRALGLTIVGVPVDEHGMRVELVEDLLQQHHPRMIYTIPNFQNPAGASLSTARRRRLLSLAARYNVPILEDDFVGDLRYEGRALPAIKALDHVGQVIYVGTFSKLLMPGLRVGFLVADGPILEEVGALKQVHDLTTSPLMQRVIDRYVTVGRYQTHLRRTTRAYRARRDAMHTAVREFLPSATVAPSHGGLFTWLHLSGPVSTQTLVSYALDEGVDFAPGQRFFANPTDGEHFLRLNFATRTPDEIGQGMLRLGIALNRALNDEP